MINLSELIAALQGCEERMVGSQKIVEYCEIRIGSGVDATTFGDAKPRLLRVEERRLHIDPSGLRMHIVYDEGDDDPSDTKEEG